MARPKVVLDVMGSDRGPAEVIAGGVLAARSFDAEIILSGDQDLIRDHLSRRSKKYIKKIITKINNQIHLVNNYIKLKKKLDMNL